MYLRDLSGTSTVKEDITQHCGELMFVVDELTDEQLAAITVTITRSKVPGVGSKVISTENTLLALASQWANENGVIVYQQAATGNNKMKFNIAISGNSSCDASGASPITVELNNASALVGVLYNVQFTQVNNENKKYSKRPVLTQDTLQCHGHYGLHMDVTKLSKLQLYGADGTVAEYTQEEISNLGYRLGDVYSITISADGNNTKVSYRSNYRTIPIANCTRLTVTVTEKTDVILVSNKSYDNE
jgi:hypothetical protein